MILQCNGLNQLLKNNIVDQKFSNFLVSGPHTPENYSQEVLFVCATAAFIKTFEIKTEKLKKKWVSESVKYEIAIGDLLD